MHRICTIILATVLLFSLFDLPPPNSTTAKQVDEPVCDWPCIGGDIGHSGRIIEGCHLPSDNLFGKWFYKTSSNISTSPAVSNGKLFFGTEDGIFYALDTLTGKKLWSHNTKYQAPINNAFVSSNEVFFATGDHKIHSLTTDRGNLNWTFDLENPIRSAPVFWDEKLYFGCDDINFYCLDARVGKILWEFRAFGPISSSPAISSGYVYFADEGGDVFCLNAKTGEKIWGREYEKRIYSGVTVFDNKVYFGAEDFIRCLDASSGETIWEEVSGFRVFSTPSVADGRIVFGNEYNTILCLNADDGKTLWSIKTNDRVRSQALIGVGRAYVPCDSGQLYIINLESGEVLRKIQFWGKTYSPALANRKIFVTCLENNVVCLDEYFESKCDCKMFKRDVQRRTIVPDGCAPKTNNLTELWSITTGGNIRTSPAIWGGRVFFGSDDHFLYCADAWTGKVYWRSDLESDMSGGPAIYDDKVYIATGNIERQEFFYLYCLDSATGATLWRFGEYKRPILSSPLVVDGNVYFTCQNNALHCLDAQTGNAKWEFFSKGPTYGSPAYFDNRVFFVNAFGEIFCVNAKSGTQIWSFQAKTPDSQPSGSSSTPAIDDGKIYFGAYDATVYCLETESGNKIWQTKIGEWDQELGPVSPSVRDGRIYVYALANKPPPRFPNADEMPMRDVHCLDANTGKIIWKYKVKRGGWPPPDLAETKLYGASHEGELYCLDKATGKRLWSTTLPDVHSGPVVWNGRLFAGAHDKKLHCFAGMPKLMVNPKEIDLGEIEKGNIEQTSFKVWNGEVETLKGTITHNTLFLTIDTTSFTLTTEKKEVTCKIDATNLEVGKTYKIPITVTSTNGETEIINITFTVTVGPIIEVTPPIVDFGQVRKGTYLESKITIKNIGKGTLQGTILSSELWCSIEYEKFIGNSNVLTITVDSTKLELDKDYKAIITFNSNGGKAEVTVKIKLLKLEPKLVVYPTELIFTNAKPDQIISGSFFVGNAGDEVLKGTIKLNANWLKATPDEFELTTKQQEIKVEISTSKLPIDKQETTIVNVSSNGGQANVTITVKVIPWQAKLKVTPKSIIISQAEPDKIYKQTVLIENIGEGHLFGTIKTGSGTPWLKIDKTKFDIEKTPTELQLTINTAKMSKGSSMTGKIVIETNGGNQEIGVVVVLPNRKRTTVEIYIGKNVAKINGKPVILDSPPYLAGGTTMVPVRFIAEAFGAKVTYDKKQNATVITKGKTMITLWVGKKLAKVDGKNVSLDVAPEMKNNRIFVPIRFISQIFGADISWDKNTKQITIGFWED